MSVSMNIEATKILGKDDRVSFRVAPCLRLVNVVGNLGLVGWVVLLTCLLPEGSLVAQNFDGNGVGGLQRTENANYHEELGAIDRILKSRHDASTFDSNSQQQTGMISPTSYTDRIPAEPAGSWNAADLEQIASLKSDVEASPGTQLNFVERERAGQPEQNASGQPDRNNLGQLLANIGMNLAFVLLIAIGFIAIAKQWMKTPGGSAEPKDTESTKLRVIETLNVAPKAKLMVVQWKTSQVLVATDPNGVKAMIPLTSSFVDTLEEVESEFGRTEERDRQRTEPTRSRSQNAERSKAAEGLDGVDEKLMKMLLSSVTKKAGSNKNPQRAYSSKG